VDNTLAYIDQGSFLALRALGRGPLIQFTWIYERNLDLDGLRRLHANLAFGLLGRCIERSALPFGRDRWVASAGPAVLEIAARDRPRSDAWAWADERLSLPLDPQFGPQWRLGVQPLIGGGAAVTLVVSHSVGDAKAIIDAVVEAVNGDRRDLGYPPPGYRTRRQAVREDGRRALRDLPETAKAIVSAVRVARAESEGLSTSVKSGGKVRSRGDDTAIVVPNATVFFGLDQWDARAKSLGGSSNSLFLGLAARLGQILGRVDDEGLALASLPVSERVAGDTRANALTATTVKIDPNKVVDDLSDVRQDLKHALTALAETPNQLLGPLALVPWTPAFLVRRLEGMVQQVGYPIGCSNVGELPPEMNRPDGRDADRLAIRMMEPQLTTKDLERMGGVLFVGSGRINDGIFVTTAGWMVGGPNTTQAFRDSFRQALTDMGLSGTVE
jgi:diacylglycerol O-acyltransferase